MLTYEQFLATRRFSTLDGLRAISILLVFTAHPAYQKVWPRFHGASGVTIFFVLSGFLITTLLLREEQRRGRASLAAFYLRRVFRIYPMFFAVLALYCVLLLVVGASPERRAVFVENLPYFVFLLPEHAIFFTSSSVPVPFDGAWSIGIEEKFYLVWPVLGFVLLNARRSRVAVLIAIAGLCSVCDVAFSWGNAVAPYALIAFGALAALALDSPLGYAWARHLGRPAILATLTVIVVALQCGTSAILTGRGLYAPYGALVALLLIGLVVSTHPGTRWLSSRPMVYIGELSYVLYLIHNFGLNAAEAVLPDSWGFPGSLLSTVVGISLAFVGADLLHRFLEEPLRQYGARLAQRHRPVATVPAVEAPPSELPRS